jgi:hypothetical protein
VAYKADFGLDYWIYCTLYIQNSWPQRYGYSTHFAVHRYTSTIFLGLHYSCPGNGFITLTLSLQITHEVFLAQSNSFLAIILQLPISKTRLNSIPSSYPGRLASRNSTFHFRLDYCSILLNTALWRLCTDHAENTASIKEACWLVRCLALDVLFLRSYACAGMCLPSRCLTMCLYITVFYVFHNRINWHRKYVSFPCSWFSLLTVVSKVKETIYLTQNIIVWLRYKNRKVPDINANKVCNHKWHRNSQSVAAASDFWPKLHVLTVCSFLPLEANWRHILCMD